MKKIILLMLTLVLWSGGSLQDIKAAESIENAGPSGPPYIAVIPKGINIPFWNAVRQGAEQAAREYNLEMTYEGPSIETDIGTQIDILGAVLNRNPQGVVIAAISTTALEPSIREADRRGIPIIGFDTLAESPLVKTNVATDNYKAAALAADKMAEFTGGEGKIGLIIFDEVSESGVSRREGFVQTIRQKYPEIELVPTAYSGTQRELAERTAEEMLVANPDLKGIFGASEAISLGIIDAAKNLNRVQGLTIVGFDSGKLLMDAIREGTVAGAISQNPYDIGYKAVEAAYRAYLGELLPTFIDTGFVWYNKDNIDSPEVQKFLYE